MTLEGCEGYFYLYKGKKPSDIRGFCRRCNKEAKQRSSLLSLDKNKNYKFECQGACKRSYSVQKDKLYCEAGYCKKCFEAAGKNFIVEPALLDLGSSWKSTAITNQHLNSNALSIEQSILKGPGKRKSAERKSVPKRSIKTGISIIPKTPR